MRIVREALNLNERAACCCNVLVVNGGRVRCLASRLVTFETLYTARSRSSLITIAAVSLLITGFPFCPGTVLSEAEKRCLFCADCVWRSAVITHYSWGLKASISRSRSTIILSAIDCTLPAESPFRLPPGILDQRKLLPL